MQIQYKIFRFIKSWEDLITVTNLNNIYTMKVSEKLIKEVKKFQEGGAIPTESTPTPAPATPAPQAGGGEDPMAQIVQAAMQAVESNDGQMALQVLQAFLMLLQESMGGQAAAQEAPAEPVMQKKGGRLAVVRRIK